MRSEKRAIWVAQHRMLIALAFIFNYPEAIIPVSIPVPGVGLGLANLVTIMGLYTVGAKGTTVVSLIHIILVGLTFENMFNMVYSLAGGSLNLLLMIPCRKNNWFSQTGVSITGGIGHNIGQLVIASIVVQTTGVFYYLPALLMAGVLAGVVIGLLGGMVAEQIRGVVKKT